jgi:HPt (histidine-containing phosphotransfer) domain-containing protein
VDADARAALRQMQAARPELVPQLVDLFLNESVRSLEALRETQERGDGHALAKMAHALKGACLQLGETGMADWCERLEAAGQSGDRDAANAALADLSEAFEQASARLLVLKARAARAG